VQAEPVQRKPLEPMQFAGAVTYGNWFDFPQAKNARIELEIWRAGSEQPVKTSISLINSHRR
jgi:hypothetical protein